jgi:NAD(P)-dependent dehydrogenase (short-subunit alcohol dehydrogenase family)
VGFLDGRAALVTGAAKGVGRGIALALAREGARVAVCDIDDDAARDTVREIADRGDPEAVALHCDVTAAADIDTTVRDVVGRLGTVDILVNNAMSFASFVRGQTMLDITRDEAELDFLSGPLAVLAFMQACHPHLVGGGVVLNASSAAGHRPSARVSVYSAAKAAIVALTRSAAEEWGRDGIRVLAYAPLALSSRVEDTRRNRPENYAAMVEGTFLGRMGDCELDIGRPAAWLCGPDAAFMTGSVVALDGGGSFVH